MNSSNCEETTLDSRLGRLLRCVSLFRFGASARSWNAASAIILFTARVLASMAQLKYVERYFGGSFSGLAVVSNQVLLYVTLLELGLAQATISFLYEPILRRDDAKTSALLAAVRSDVRRLILIGSLVVFPVLAIYARFLGNQVPYTTIVATLWLVALGAFIQLAAVHFQAYLNAAERLGWVNLILGLGYLVKTAIGLTLALHFRDYLWLPASICFLTTAEFMAMKLVFSRLFPHFHATEWQWAANTIRRRARFALIHKVAGVAYYQSDFIILSLTVGLMVVRDYAKFQYIAAGLLSAVGTIAIALTSSFAYTQMRRRPEARFRQYVRLQFGASVVGAIACAGYIYVAPDIVRWAFGGAETIGLGTLSLFGLALFLNIVKIADDMTITARGAFRVGYGIPIVEVPVYIVLGVVLTRRLGFPGILIASVATNLLITVVVKGALLAREVFDASRAQWYARRAANALCALLLVVPLVALHWIASLAFASDAACTAFWCVAVLVYGAAILRLLLVRPALSLPFVSSLEPEP